MWGYCYTIVEQYKTMSRDLEYKIFAQRLSDENIKFLKKERKKYSSWNLFFNKLIKNYGSNKRITKTKNKKRD